MFITVYVYYCVRVFITAVPVIKLFAFLTAIKLFNLLDSLLSSRVPASIRWYKNSPVVVQLDSVPRKLPDVRSETSG
jgi:hypothetical protein